MQHSFRDVPWLQHVSVGPSVPERSCLQVLQALKTKGISIRVASPKLVMEEAPESYKASSLVLPCMSNACVSSGGPQGATADLDE